MKIQNTKLIKMNAMKLVALAMFLTATVFAGGAAAQANSDISKSTGMFGITRNQTARLNVVRLGDGSIDSPDIRILLSFVDGDGNVVSQKVYELGSGRRGNCGGQQQFVFRIRRRIGQHDRQQQHARRQ